MELHYELDLVKGAESSRRWHWKVIRNGVVVYDGYAANERKAERAASLAADVVMDVLCDTGLCFPQKRDASSDFHPKF